MLCLVSNGLIIEVVSAWRWHFLEVVQYKEEPSPFGFEFLFEGNSLNGDLSPEIVCRCVH